nr:hypothetical protein [Tanacetum cinerariifolium]
MSEYVCEMWSENHPMWGVRVPFFIADFRCLAEASSRSLPSVLLFPDRSHVWEMLLDSGSAILASSVITCLLRDVSLPLLEIDLFAFIHTLDPTKVKIVEREHFEDEPLLLQTTVGRTVPLLPVAPDRTDNELETSVDMLFDEGGSDVTPLQPRRQRKRKTVVADAGGSSYPPKKLREDHGTPSGPSVDGKSRSAVQRLLAGAVMNAEVRGEHIPTFPFVTSSVYATPEREGGDHTHSVTRLNLRIISAPQRFVISSDSSHNSGANVAEAEVDSIFRSSVSVMTTVTITTSMVDHAIVVKEKTVKPFLFVVDSSSAGGVDPNAGVFSDLTESDFLSVTNGSRLDDGRVCRKMVDEFAPPKIFASVRGMKHDQLFTEFNVGAARQMSLSAEVRMHAEYNIKEKRRLKSAAEEKDELLKARDKEIENLKAQMVWKDAEAAEAIHLRAEASNFVTVEKSLLG